jgi:phospholipid/cholesterol/gamma-HCH transport system substrate-binding protein
MERESSRGAVPKTLQFRVGLLLGLALVLGAGFVTYVLYARGIFEATQRVTLLSENAEGVGIGMDLTFSGFPIGRVQRLALDEEGRARIEIEVPLKDAHWLRAGSVFTLERGLFGGASIRAHTGNLRDAPLPDGAVRPVLRGDTSEEIPRLVASLRSILDNIESLTGPGGNLQASMASLRTIADRAAGKQGAVGALLGNDADVQRLLGALDRTNALLASVNSLVGKTEQRVFASGGVLDGTERAVAQANSLLGDVRETLKRADGILADAEQVSGNAKAATTDLAALRAEVDDSVRKISALIDEINRKWPFERKTEIRLP